MNILSLCLDRNLADPKFVGTMRQVEYYRGHQAKVYILETGAPAELRVENVQTIIPGGANKMVVLLRTLRALFFTTKQFDLVIAQDVLFIGFLGYVIALRHGARLITQVHGDYLDNPRWLTERKGNYLRNAIGKFVLRHSDGVRCVSKKIVDDLHDRLQVPAEKMLSAPIGTDLSMFTPEGERADIGAPYVLFVGRLLPEKSPFLFGEVLIPLMKERADLHAVFAGDGPLRVELETQFVHAGFGERVHFLGHVGGADLAKYYRAARVMLHTAAWEGWGMPMVEALACGCPVVTTDTGCAGEAVVDGVNGIVVPIDDVALLRQATAALLTDDQLYAKLHLAGPDAAAEWSFEALSKRIRSWYETIGTQRK
jgi:glycosyltransferase involved in cell wall biosynthesis